MDYRDIIESRYNREAWQQLLHDIFRSKVSFWREPSAVHASSRLAKQALNIGKISLADGESIAIYEVELTDNVDIERNRRGIRDMLTTDWRNMGYAGAFMFCYRQNESVLRFSYVSESWSFADDGTYKKDCTDTRRFTYLLGEGHRSRTAIQQFESLKKSGLSLKDLTKAFSVDAVSDMFFDDYKQQYEDIIAFITGKRMVKRGNKWEETIVGEPNPTIFSEFRVFADSEKAIRDYVKKLMGRLVFLQFLQKKGWLGVPVNAKWGDGDPEFIQHLFDNAVDKDTFVDNVLEPLFNDINSERKGDIASPAVGKDIRVPYLNGGLFEPDAADAVNFPLPAKYMKSMLDFFASYNFTIDENDPDDAEMGVDPEMLGRIFENLLEDNKDKGAFYTPKEIVNYMCRESLIAYLQTDIEKEEQKEAIRHFVTTHQFVEHLPGDTLEMLKNVKICDPAIGSGAFPMGLLKELYLCRATIEGFDPKKAAEIKKHIIQQNIYGVDIERGAVDTARLRFWLALIVDEESPEALPNLDFKIMQGNSLLESFHSIDLSNLLGTQAINQVRIIFDDESCAQELFLKSLRDFYSCSNANQKKALRAKIDTQLRDLLRTRITKPDLQKEIDTLTAKNDKFFLWHTWFSDVFSKGGFDIVIGNPPYVGEKDHKYLFRPIKNSALGKYYLGKMDYFYFFFHLSLELANYNGISCFITTNYYPTATGGRILRKDFKERTSILQLINFNEFKIFDSALGQHNLITILRKTNTKHEMCLCANTSNHGQSKAILETILSGKDSKTEYEYLSQDLLYETDENYIRLNKKNATDPINGIFDKISNGNRLLGEISVVNIGMRTGADKLSQSYIEKYSINLPKNTGIYVLTTSEKNKMNLNAKEEQLILPWFKNSDIGKYCSKLKNDLWLINLSYPQHENINFEDYPNIYNHIIQFKDVLKGRRSNDNGLQAVLHKGYWWAFTMRQLDFNSEKIIAPQRSPRNTFGYNNVPWYASMDVYYITSIDSEYSLKYVLALLNSKLYYLWLYYKGKRKGENLELYQKPLSEIPIKKATREEQCNIVKVVDQILAKKIENPKCDTTSLENEIDNLVYKLYSLSEEEILIVENTAK